MIIIDIFCADFFPVDMRAKGMSISSATNWIMNFTVAMVTPVMFNSIRWKTYIVFMCFCIVGLLYSIFILPELKGKSLEDIDQVFGDKSGAEDQRRRERIAQQIGLDKVARDVQHIDNDPEASAGAEKKQMRDL